jgi:hypothetical protein
MIQKFEQFINESHAGGVFDSLRKPIDEFIERVEERTKIFTERIQEISDNMNKAVSVAMEEFGDIIVGEPIVNVDRDLSEISVQIHTNVPHYGDASNDEETPFDKLEDDVAFWLDGFKDIRSEVYYKPNDDGNCIITLKTYVVDEDNFGGFTDALEKFGEEY